MGHVFHSTHRFWLASLHSLVAWPIKSFPEIRGRQYRPQNATITLPKKVPLIVGNPQNVEGHGGSEHPMPCFCKCLRATWDNGTENGNYYHNYI